VRVIPQEKDLPYPLDKRLGEYLQLVWMQGLEEKSSIPVGG
jgi:hypothetical protein